MADSDFTSDMPPQFAALKGEIAASIPDFESKATKAWGELIAELATVTEQVAKQGSSYIPEVEFSDLGKLSKDDVDKIKRIGSVVIHNIVDDEEAMKWKTDLEEFVKANPDVEGFPIDNKQFFELFWTKSQVRARAHPNMLAVSKWLNNVFHVDNAEGVDLNTPLTYADRFRIRHPGGAWTRFPPHVDGGAIERWQDEKFRACFMDVLSGEWRKHDPYDLTSRLHAKTSMYGRPNQCSVLRTFQGWLAMSETGPHKGTLRVFPDILLSNCYIILRPFFKPLVDPTSPDALDAKNWAFDITSPNFPGIYERDGGYGGPRPTERFHPHLALDKTMISIPDVKPGDAVFWHTDVIHSVEEEHLGNEDSAVMYIGAVPSTPGNLEYIKRQAERFVNGVAPPDYARTLEDSFIGIGKAEDVTTAAGRYAMGLTAA
ncbi:hypothetical protein BD626DRAFT_240198 [Schizophyllum amplum]|uniref:DUF1479-domain-containing protein n=1 Tax=Schizophyllum amplum TaxID=97359 RepID=A0A550CJY7_9AGAR|nr:hypothetical protein BD626DRAFT_240198 [Auriculariopsis ampla]